MVPILILSLRQITGLRRLLIVTLLALVPVALTLIARISSGGDTSDQDEFVPVVIGTLIAGVVIPIVTMALATTAFGNDLEDRTLSFVVLTPIARWKIVLPRLVAPILITAPLAVVSGAATLYIALGGNFQAIAAVCAGLLVGVVAYASVFTWAGLMTTRALSFGIVYVFVWEAVLSGLIPGVKYLSIRAYTVSVMYGLNTEGFEDIADSVVSLPVALVASGIILVAFWLLTVYRLKRMDVP